MFELIIVGGGGAGLSAAKEAASRGCSALVIDEQETLGGVLQCISQQVATGSLGWGKLSGSEVATKLATEAASAGVKVLPAAKVWGLFATDGSFQVAIEQDGKGYSTSTVALIIAAGGYVAPYPFPGWDSPEVLDAYEALRIVQAEEDLPGERVGVLGATELAILTALQMEALKGKPTLIANEGQLNKDSTYYVELASRGITILEGHQVREFSGGRLRLVSPEGGERELELDCLIAADRVSPEIEPAFLVDCRIGFREEAGGYFTAHNELMATSKKGVFVAGKAAGMDTLEGACLSGRLAGLSAASYLGHAPDEAEIEQLKKKIGETCKQHQENIKFAKQRRELPDEFAICHCGYIEKKTVKELKEVIEAGAETLDDIKRITGIGMGPCQQRLCRYPVADYLAARMGRTMEEIGPMKVRVPIRPVTVGAIASSRREVSEARFGRA